jgi:hypothetical protein
VTAVRRAGQGCRFFLKRQPLPAPLILMLMTILDLVEFGA